MLRLSTALLLSAVFLVGCATSNYDTAAAHEAEFNQRVDALGDQLIAGQISYVEQAQGVADLARQYYPQDYRLHALRDYKVYIAKQMERKEITPEQFDFLWKQKNNAFMAERNDQIASQRAADAQFRYNVMMDSINTTQNRIQRNAPQTINCSSTNIGGVVNTNCR